MNPTEIPPITDFGPLPPIDSAVYSATGEWIYFWVFVALAIAGIVYAIIYGRKNKSLLPLMCMIGGALTIIIEPLIDSHLQVWWPKHNQPDLFVVWGRHMPLMILFVVLVYFGVGTLLRLWMLNKYGVKAPLWQVYFIEVAMALALEIPAINLGLWHYYGDQGLRLGGYPLWWPMVGGACGCLAGTVLYKLTPYLKGWKQLLGAIIAPMCVAAVYWGVGWPMFFAINLQPATWIIYIAATFSAGLAILTVWLSTILCGKYDYQKKIKQEQLAKSIA